MDHKLDTNDLITQLRPLVQGLPTREKWAAIVASFEDASLIKNRAARERALHYAQGAMRHWPHALRTIPEAWRSFLTHKRQKTPHVGLALCKVIELETAWLEPERTRAHRMLSNEVFDHLAMAYAPYRELEARHIQTLCSLPWMASLECLNLTGNRIGDEGVCALTSCEEMTRLEELEISHNRLTDHSLAALSKPQAPNWGQLRSLDLSSLQRESFFYDDAVIALAQSETCRKLQTLRLNGHSSLSTRSFHAILTSPQCTALTHLAMQGARLNGPCMDVLKQPLARLRVLKLSGSRLDEGGHIAWDELEGLSQLEELNVASNMLDEDSLIRLLSSPHLGQLRKLVLHNNYVGLNLMRALGEAQLPHLTHLCVGYTSHQVFEWSWLERWLESPMHAQLKEVDLVGLDYDEHLLDEFTRAKAARLT